MHVVRPWLAIGTYVETQDDALLRAHGIGSMLQLASPVEQPGISALYLPVTDGEPLAVELLRQGAGFVRDEHKRGRNVLVACAAGISRSVTFAIAGLCEVEGIGIFAAYQSIVAVHRKALPHFLLWDALGAAYGAEGSFEEVVRLRLRL